MWLSAAALAQQVTCEDAAARAEAAWHVPAGLLAAVGRVESGRWDAAARRVRGWPFAIDAGGRDYFPHSAAEAMALVRNLQLQGIRSIDVGCFQMNLFYHPDAFPDLATAFDPMENGDAAGRFLSELHGRGGGWDNAVRLYHSATPDLGEAYRRQVYASLADGAFGPLSEVADSPARAFDPVVVMWSPGAMRVGVFGPPRASDAPPRAWRAAAGRLPRVIYPAGFEAGEAPGGERKTKASSRLASFSNNGRENK